MKHDRANSVNEDNNGMILIMNEITESMVEKRIALNDANITLQEIMSSIVVSGKTLHINLNET